MPARLNAFKALFHSHYGTRDTAYAMLQGTFVTFYTASGERLEGLVIDVCPVEGELSVRTDEGEIYDVRAEQLEGWRD